MADEQMPMRILHVTHQYAPAIGGAEQYVTDLSEELAARGHHVDVFTARSVDSATWASELPPRELRNGVQIYRFAALRRSRWLWAILRAGNHGYLPDRARWREPLIWLGNGPVMPGFIGRVLRSAGQYDVIHINQLHFAHSWPAFAAAQRAGIPVLLSPLIHTEQWSTFDVGYLRTMLAKADGVIALTEAERAFLAEQKMSAKAMVAGAGQSLANFPPQDAAAARRHFGLPPEAFVLLFLGRKTGYKGLDLCAGALRRLRAEERKPWLLAVGPETDDSRRLWAQLRAEGLDDCLVVRGAVDADERLLALAACDLLALPSVGESFGIVYLEAWAYGKPVLGANIPAVAALITHGSDGLLIDPADPAQMSQYVAQLMDDAALARRLGEAGHEKLVRRYTIKTTTDLVEGFYRRVRRHKQSAR
jgi:glycosyltransferase involved in cell wall biosynthesis